MRRGIDRRALRRVLVAVGLVVLVGGGWWMARGAGGSRASDWAVVERGNLVISIEVEGTLAAVHSHLLTPPAFSRRWEYKISSMAPDGTEVKEGDPVLAFDTSELERLLLDMTAALDSAEKEIEKKHTNIVIRRRDDELRLAEARANLEKAVLKLDRPEELVAAREIATLMLDRDLVQKEVAYLEKRRRLLDEADEVELSIVREERDQAALRVRELKSGIERMTLSAPRDGTVIHVTDRRGEKKRIGDAVWRRDRILEIPDLTLMMARGIIDEADAGRLALGQRVELRLDAYPDSTFAGSISKLAKTVQPKTRNSPLRVVRIDIALDETVRDRMRPEMRFRGTIEVERHDDVLLAPVSSIRQTASGATVHRRSISGTRERPVELGKRNNDKVEIVHGLTEGDEVSTRQ